MALATAAPILKKTTASTFFVNVELATANILRDCFRQFNIEISSLGTKDLSRLDKEKVDACVVFLDDRAEEVLAAARNSRSNRRMVIFGVCANAADAARFSKYGINVLLESPVDRQNALRAVRSAHSLIVNEFRRYVRVPLVVKVEGTSGPEYVSGTTEDISAGGMSVRYKGTIEDGDEVHFGLHLPGQPVTKVKGSVFWVRPAEMLAGIRFELHTPGREAVKRWIDQYLEIA